MQYLLKMYFLANIAPNLKSKFMYCNRCSYENVLCLIFTFILSTSLWADNKADTYHFKPISTTVNYPGVIDSLLRSN